MATKEEEVVEEKTPLEILEERLTKLETLSVREDSPAEWCCQKLIRVVMASFAPPKLAVVMNALLTFGEQERVSVKQLSERMQLDKKQMREYLAALKSMGYVIETTGKTEWAQKSKNQRGRGNYNRNNGKAAMYHVDFFYFLMMTKFRLHSILKRLSVQQKKEDETGDGFVCRNEDCFCCYKIKKIMDLIYEQQKSSTITKDSHFVCSECGEPLIDAQKYYDHSNATLTKTMRFNLKMKSLRLLLTETENKMMRERQKMMTEVSKLEDAMDRLKNGSGHGAYKASTLSFDPSKMNKSKNNGLTGLAHLDRIGRRNTFECKLNQNEEDNNEDDGQRQQSKKKEEEIVVKESDIKTMTNLIKEYEIKRDDARNMNIEDEQQDYDLYHLIKIKVNDQDTKMSDILSGDMQKYEGLMSAAEWNQYQQTLDELGFLEVELL